jgi:hypothetical protein
MHILVLGKNRIPLDENKGEKYQSVGTIPE